MFYLEYKEGKSGKFWKLELLGHCFIVTFGKIGSDGQSQEKVFDSPEKALKEAEKLVNSKRKKGYADATLPVKAAVPPKAATKVLVAPMHGPEPIVDDGKPKYWFDEELEDQFDLTHMADPQKEMNDDCNDEIDCDDDEYDDYEDEEDEADNPNDPPEERVRFASRKNELKLLAEVWESAKASGESDIDWLSDALVYKLESKKQNMADIPVMQYLLEQGAQFPIRDGYVFELDGTYGEHAEFFYPTDGPFHSKFHFANYIYAEYAKDPKPARIVEIYGTMLDKACAQLIHRLEEIVPKFKDFVPKSRRDQFSSFENLLTKTPINKEFLGMVTKDDLNFPNEFWCYLLETCCENPTSANVMNAFSGYLDEAFSETMKLLAKRFVEYASYIRAGVKDEESGFDFLPEGGKLDKRYFGFQIRVPNEYWVYIYLDGGDEENPFDFKHSKISGLTTEYFHLYCYIKLGIKTQ